VPVQQTLTADEARVIGCLMEKSVLTPDQYPMTLNALTGACNQKTGRNPVVSMDPGLVQRTARDLQAKHLVRSEENFRRGVEKYKQRLCNTTHSDYQFGAAEFAIVCLLLLRGPQTPGELRAHSGRLHSFADNSEVIAALRGLIEREGGPLVVQLARAPGRKDSEYMHLFSGPVEAEPAAQAGAPRGSLSQPMSLTELAERVSRLEVQLAALRARLGDDEDEDESRAGAETGA
jgi:uncharacterized protein YceH (UPF0502 family)